MSREQPKFRPNIPEEIRQGQLAILDAARKRIEDGEVSGKVDHDAEFFLVTVTLGTGKEITECIPKNSRPLALDKDGGETTDTDDAIEAIQRFYPKMGKPNLREAVRRLKESRL